MWDTKKADCLRKYAVWTKSSSPSSTTTATTTASSTTASVVESFQNAVRGGDAIEGRSVDLRPVDEWEGFLCYVIPSVCVVIICISIGILAYFLLEYLHKKRQLNGWSASRRLPPHRPVPPHMLFLSRAAYSRANSITSFVSLPPAYNTCTASKKAKKDIGQESPPPSYETALNNVRPVEKV